MERVRVALSERGHALASHQLRLAPRSDLQRLSSTVVTRTLTKLCMSFADNENQPMRLVEDKKRW